MITFYTYIVYFEDNTFHSVGVTSDLKRRSKLLSQIERKKVKKNCKIVYYEEYTSSKDAIQRENELKKIPVKVLNSLIRENNPALVNLFQSN